MIQKESYLNPIDRTNVLSTKVFHLYKGFHRKHSYVGNFVKISVKSAKPEALLQKKSKSIALIVRLKFKSKKGDGSYLYFNDNSCILIKRKLILRSKDIPEIADFNIKRKKLFFKFAGIL